MFALEFFRILQISGTAMAMSFVFLLMKAQTSAPVLCFSVSYQLLLLEEEHGQFVRSAENISLRIINLPCYAGVDDKEGIISSRLVSMRCSFVFVSW